MTIYNKFTDNSFSALYFTLAMLSCYFIFLIKGNLLPKIFWMLFPIALLYGIELSTISSIIYIHGGNIALDLFALPNIYRFQFVGIAKTIEIILLVILVRNKLHLHNFSYTVLFPATLVCFFSILGTSYAQLVEFTDIDKPIAEAIVMRFAAAFLAINLAYLSFLAWMQKSNQKILSEQLQQQQFELKQKNYEELSTAHGKLKAFQEDVQENLRSLWWLAKRHKVPQIDQYIMGISQINQQFKTIYPTGDDVIDTILSSKEATANSHYIELKTKIELPPPGLFDSVDFGTILINLVDNAIEALDHLVPADGVERTINLIMKTEGEFYTIEVKNPSIEKDSSYLSQSKLTTFSPSQNTGLGLKIIKALVDRCNGNMLISLENFLFTVRIQLPLKQISNERIDLC